ncbi:MAG TPA: FAD-dependent oxidoreductase, partial [Rubrivivax sp.]|nr:FAD-dependent oxidoreductase [Rubrivivax sp.]
IDVPLSHAMQAKDSLGSVGGTQLTLARWSYARLEALVRELSIDCGWQRTGRHYAAATNGGRRALDGVARQFEQLGEPTERVGGDALHERLGTRYYRAALFNPSCTLVQPAALIRGLADSLPQSVRLHERSRVTGWTSAGGRHLLRTAGGTLSARRVVWATHTEVGEFTPLGRRFLELYTYAGVTPPLPDEALGRGCLAEWGVLPALRAGSTVRRLAGGRILLRSLWSYGRPLAADEVRRALQPLLAARFPQAAAHGFEHVWGGPVSITRHSDPYLGEFRPGAFSFTGCNGSGIVKGSAYGMLLAEMAAGRPSEALALARREPQAAWIPPEPLRRIAVAVTLARNARHAGAEI